MFYDKLSDKKVKCNLCPRHCVMLDDHIGFCRVRKNRQGKLYSLSYAKPVSACPDPIEKKPLFQFRPGTKVFSIGTNGCNFHCKHCQNWDISQKQVAQTPETLPNKIVELALKTGCQGIAYTYNDPIVFYEYSYDIINFAKKKAKSLYHVWVSNGYIEEKPMKKIAPLLDAINIDIKGFNNKVYKELCDADFETFLQCLKNWAQTNVWIELTNLIIPGWNDNPEEIKAMCNWIIKNIGDHVPIHFSKYFPCYQLRAPETPVSTLEKAYKIAKDAGMKYVYIGNMMTSKENTYCYHCKELLIERHGYQILRNKITSENKCPLCGFEIHVK